MCPARVAPCDDVIYQALHDELILLNMKSQQYFGLDDVGSDMWKLLVEHGDVEVVADRISEQYHTDRETVRNDLAVLVDRLIAAGLLKEVVLPRHSTGA